MKNESFYYKLSILNCIFKGFFSIKLLVDFYIFFLNGKILLTQRFLQNLMSIVKMIHFNRFYW